MTTIVPRRRSAHLRLTTPVIPSHRHFHRPSPGTQLPDSIQARLLRLPVLALAWIFTANQLPAASIVTITNDWAAVETRIVVPKPPDPPEYEWVSATQGAAELSTGLSRTGPSPTGFGQPYIGNASASIGPTVSLGGLPISTPTGYTKVFGSRILVDDTQGCEAYATIDSIWSFTVGEDPAQYYFRQVSDNIGSSMHFTIFDRTTQLLVQSGSSWTGGGTLEPYHDYLLEFHHRAPFGTGDGQMGFAFGFSNSVQVEFASDRTHLAIPEVGTAGILGIALAGFALLHRKIDRH